MNDIRACLQRLVEIWDEPNLRHEMPGAMWKAKEALKAEAEREAEAERLRQAEPPRPRDPRPYWW